MRAIVPAFGFTVTAAIDNERDDTKYGSNGDSAGESPAPGWRYRRSRSKTRDRPMPSWHCRLHPSVLNYEVRRPRPRRGECGCENQCRKDEDDGSIEHLGIRVPYRML